MAASADETSVSVAIEQVLSELQSISSLKEEKNTALEAFLRRRDVLALLPTGFGKSSLACGCVFVVSLYVICFVDLIGLFGLSITNIGQSANQYFAPSQNYFNGRFPDGYAEQIHLAE